MNESKSFASLGATLLARKGGAKPAMRPQLAMGGMGGGAQAAQAIADDLEDLGWNDMGHDEDVPDRSADVLQLTPAPHNPEAEAKTDRGSPKPAVRSIHEELAERLAQSGQDQGGQEYLVQQAKPAKPVAKQQAIPAISPLSP